MILTLKGPPDKKPPSYVEKLFLGLACAWILIPLAWALVVVALPFVSLGVTVAALTGNIKIKYEEKEK